MRPPASRASREPSFDSGSFGPDSQGEDRAAPEPAPASRAQVDGREYLRLNLGELYDLATQHKSENLDRRFAVRGFVYRNPELDKAGEFILFRVAMYCCFADATSVGFACARPAESPCLPRENGSWPTPAWPARPNSTTTPSRSATRPSPRCSRTPCFWPTSSNPPNRPRPGLGMMYEWRTQEPYAF